MGGGRQRGVLVLVCNTLERLETVHGNLRRHSGAFEEVNENRVRHQATSWGMQAFVVVVCARNGIARAVVEA